MFSTISQGRLPLLPVLLLLLLSAGLATPAFAINFNAYWLYRQAGGDRQDTRREFQQRYSLGVSPSLGLTYQPTRAITASANVSYSRVESSVGQEIIATDQLTPQASLRLANDIFLAQVAGSRTQRYRDGNPEKGDTSWDGTLASTWQIPLMPKVSFNYGERKESPLINRYRSITVSWDLLFAQLDYVNQKNENEDEETHNLSETQSQFGRLKTNGQLFDGRISYNLAQLYRRSTSNATTLVGQALSLVTDPTVGPDPEDVVLSGNALLGDTDRKTAALQVPSFQRVHVGLSFDFPQQIDILHLYLDPLTAADPGIHWDLYVRNPFDTAWELEAEDIPASFDASQGRLDLAIHSFEKEIMVVAVNDSGVPLTFTEVEAGRALMENILVKSTDLLTNLGLGIRITPTLNASFNLDLESLDNDAGDARSKFSHRTTSGSLRWTPSPFLMPSLSASETRDTQTGTEDLAGRTYSLILASVPLPTMHVTLGATRTENYAGQTKTASSMQYSLYTKAQIYPDLSARLSLSQRDSEALDSEGRTIVTSSFSSRLDLTARLTRALTADLTTNYARGETDGEDTRQTASSKLQLLYRPSDLLAMRGSYETDLLGPQKPDVMTLGMTLSLLHTAKARLDLDSSFRQSDQSNTNFGLSGSWAISRNMSMQTQGHYSMAQVSTYDFFVSMNLHL